jgi:hypothetical protein
MPSTVIAAMHYYPATSTLRIIFRSGMIYDYKNVPEKVFMEMKAAYSKGTYLNQHIKPVYEFEKVR